MAKTTHPTPEQSEWIKENFMKTRNSEIAKKFVITEKRVAEWLKLLGLKKEKRVFAGRKCIKTDEIKNKPIRWLSSEYSNVTREQHVERILSMNI